jgi:hypothetical protein
MLLLVPPLAGVVELVVSARTPRAPVPEETAACRDSRRGAEHDRTGALTRLTKLRGEGATEADRVCAEALVQRLQPPTVAEQIVETVERTVNRVSRLVARGREVRLVDDPDATAAAGVLAVEAVLLLVGFGQLFLWRAERAPGPVHVGAVAAPTDNAGATALAEIMRHRLAKAGVPPGTITPGELPAIVVGAVETAAGATTGRVSALLGALGRVLAPKTGVTVEAKAFRNAKGRCALTVEATVTRTNASLAVFTVDGDTYDDAAVTAAYRVYLALVERPAVRARTPIWLSWTSPEGLREYHDALDKHDMEDHVGAADSLAKAANEEPGNALVRIGRAQDLWHVFIGSFADNVLRERCMLADNVLREKCVLVDHAVEAIWTALEAVLRAPGNDDALFLAGIQLSYAEQWAPEWCSAKRRHRSRMCALLHQVLGGDALSPDAACGEAEAYCRNAAILLLRRCVARQRYWNVLRLAWPLASRREAVDRVWPLSRVRFSRRHCALAILDGLEWDRMRRSGGVVGPGTYWRQAVRSALRRARIRSHLILVRLDDGVVEWNLACAYVGHARLIDSRAPS